MRLRGVVTFFFMHWNECAVERGGAGVRISIRYFVSLAGIKGFLPTSVIQGNPPSYEQNSWESLSVVQKWVPFPPAQARRACVLVQVLEAFFGHLKACLQVFVLLWLVLP